MCDDLMPDGHYRGWADRVAAALADELAEAPGADAFRYANLAVRGKLIGQIHDEQLAVAAGMGADLVTLAGGLNDVLRPGCDIAEVERLLGRGGPRRRGRGGPRARAPPPPPPPRRGGGARRRPPLQGV
ncbi:SGNH/GDSL hydrolase family protein, partial [Kitasatospora sp. NPDC059722]